MDHRVKLPALGSSPFFNYLTERALGVEPVSLEEVSTKPHAYFFQIGMLSDLVNPGPERAHVREELRARLADYKDRLQGSERYALVIDYSHEGPAFDGGAGSAFIAVHELMAELKFPTEHVYFLQFNRLLIDKRSGYHGWCARHGVTPMRMRYSNWWMLEQGATLQKKYAEPGRLEADRARFLSAFETGAVKTHKYLCFNYFPRLHRVIFLLHLLDQKLLKDGLVSFPGFRIPEVPDDFMYHTLLNIGGWRACDRLKPLLPSLVKISPLRVDADASATKSMLERHFVDEPYLRTVFSIVTETDFSNGYHTRRLTEKFLKSAAHMHPFMILGNPHSLEEIRRLGFQTFEPFFDEGYDRITEPEPRMNAVLANLKRKCRQTIPELLRDVRGILPIMEANLDHIAGGLWPRTREESEFPIVRELLEVIQAPGRQPVETYVPPELELPKDGRNVDEVGFPQDVKEVILHKVQFDFADTHLDQQRTCLPLRETKGTGNHCVILRLNRDVSGPFLFSFEVKLNEVERITVDLKEPTREGFRGTFDRKLGVLIESANLHPASEVTSTAAYLGDEWFRLSFLGRLRHEWSKAPLDIVIYLINPGFDYAGDPSRGIGLSKLSLRRFERAADPALSADSSALGGADGGIRSTLHKISGLIRRWRRP